MGTFGRTQSDDARVIGSPAVLPERFFTCDGRTWSRLVVGPRRREHVPPFALDGDELKLCFPLLPKKGEKDPPPIARPDGFDTKEKPVNGKHGYSRMTTKYDANGRPRERAFFDADGRPVPSRVWAVHAAVAAVVPSVLSGPTVTQTVA